MNHLDLLERDLSLDGLTQPIRLAVVATHPVQYFAPWFRLLAQRPDLELCVFYLWDFGVEARHDPGFQQAVVWDVPLLTGYSHEFAPNRSPYPALGKFFGFWNPSLLPRLRAFKPDCILMLGYNFASMMRLIFSSYASSIGLLFRGDSHRLLPRRGAKEVLRRALIVQVFRRFSAFLYVGAANLQYFRIHGVREDCLFYAPHAVDNERFLQSAPQGQEDALVWKRSLGIPSDHLVVLFAGKLEEKKRPLDLLNAFVEAGLVKTSLLFVGSGPLQTSLLAAGAAFKNIYFAPFQNQSEMPRVYATADLFVLPSFSETWGLAVNEAMCMGKPVIVSDLVGCAADLVIPGENGLVFRAGDVSHLAECLREATADLARLEAWGGRSREIVQEFSYSHATDGLMQALRVIHQKTRCAPCGGDTISKVGRGG